MVDRTSAQTCAILAAAGSGTRLANTTNGQSKQFYNLRGRPIYQWPLLQLCHHKQLAMVAVVTRLDAVSRLQDEISRLGYVDKVIVTTGGDTRQQSIRAGLNALAARLVDPEFVLVHDAARPFLTADMIDRALNGAKLHGACTAAISASDTIKRVECHLVTETLDRNTLVLVQTPQAARFSWLLAAHEKAFSNGLSVTDDAAVLEYAGHQVAVVQGSKLNIKVTEPEDLLLAEAIATLVLQQ